MVATDRDFLDPDYDEYTVSTSRSLMCCRIVAIIVLSLSLSPYIDRYRYIQVHVSKQLKLLLQNTCNRGNNVSNLNSPSNRKSSRSAVLSVQLSTSALYPNFY
uniref:Uncharacterized protein n=1 Tax=Nelumbo nucifera TaxID=4432 RepID=A0A822YK92_NELNU|nr:TPA_asm: hypothetical protein HUJ06_010812 [Nelumbo nucifera]